VHEEASKVGCAYVLRLTTRPRTPDWIDNAMGLQRPTMLLYDVLSVASDEDAVVVSVLWCCAVAGQNAFRASSCDTS
jgi:hypothetical protein